MKLSEMFKKYTWEIALFLLFCTGTIALSFFHEPWYDEFQAWAIAKSSLHDVLFFLPHYEGHPPLWHLILKLFQHFTTNPELVVKIPNLMIMFTAVWLLIFKSPFSRKIRLILPFTFFIFYQYTIISRPYCLLVLGLFLAATLYKSKNEHPFKFISTLILLSLSSAYGVVLATGITLAWVVEIWNKQNFKTFLLNFLKDKRFYAMLILFFVCLGITYLCIPYSKSHVTSCLPLIPAWERIIYIAFGLSADATAFNIFDYNNSWNESIFSNIYVFGSIFGAYIIFLMIKIFKENKSLPLFLMTFIPLTISYYFYVWPYHIGIMYILFVFCFWCMFNSTNFNTQYVFPKPTKTVLLFIFITQVFWSVCSAYREIVYDYAMSRPISNYIKENNLTRYKLLSPWAESIKLIDKNGKETPIYFMTKNAYKMKDYEIKTDINTEHQWIAVIVNPYFGKNIFYNFHVDKLNMLYNAHLPQTPEEGEKVFRKWEKLGKPDLVLGHVYVWKIWKDYYPEFVPLKSFKSGYIWKDTYSINEVELYVDKNRMKELNIRPKD